MRRTTGNGVGDVARSARSATFVGTAGGAPEEVPGSAIEPRSASVESLLMLERTRWAYEIHDGITQVVTAALLELEWLGGLIREDPAAAAQSLAGTGVELRRSLARLRGIMFNLTKGEAPDGLPGSPLAAFTRDAARRWHLSATLESADEGAEIPSAAFEAACAVIGEAISNVAKHAETGSLTVRAGGEGKHFVIEVEDAGRGFDSSRTDSNHFGLPMMRRRTEAIGGSLHVESSHGNGTRVVARLPIGWQGEVDEGPDR